MVVCIELRIPLFLVGKPGSSKSLAKTVVADAMQRNASHCDLFKNLKEVHMVSFQCSPHSSPEGIIGTFWNCARFQKGKNMEEYVSVVVLDEIGLAEDSPKMPLKTLHPLLEDGCIDNENPDPHMKVGFVGISNWALDPAKMNRGIFVSRWDPSEKELVETAKGICSVESVYFKIKHLLPKLAKGFLDICKRDSDQFFGLRDYYSLVKMVFNVAKRKETELSGTDLSKAILRNFSGQKGNCDPLDFFQELFLGTDQGPRMSTLNMIRANLDHCNEEECRYLLLLTTNSAALHIIQQRIFSKESYSCPEIVFGSGFPKDQEYAQICRNVSRVKTCMETGRTVILLNLLNLYESLYDALNQYYVYFSGLRYVDLGLGSHRVKCRVHENFRLIVIEDQEKVYEKFPVPLKNRLEKHIVDRSTDLTPWQHRVLEKLKNWVKDFSQTSDSSSPVAFSPADAFVGFHGDACASALLQALERRTKEEHQKEVGDHPGSDLISEGGSNAEVPMDVSNPVTSRGTDLEGEGVSHDDIKDTVSKSDVQSDLDHEMTPDENSKNTDSMHVEEGTEGIEAQENATESVEMELNHTDPDDITKNEPNYVGDEEDEVFESAKYHLLNCASPDSVLRLKFSGLHNQEVDRLSRVYFSQQDHHSLQDFMDSHLKMTDKEMRFIEVTTFSSLLTKADEPDLIRTLGLSTERVLLLSLHQFDTEASFCSKIRSFLRNTTLSLHILLVQMDMEEAVCKNELIASAKYCTMNEVRELKSEDLNIYVVFITKLSRMSSGSKYIGFQGGTWLSVHIDDLRDTDEMSLDLSVLCGMPISRLLSQPTPRDAMDDAMQNILPDRGRKSAYLHSMSLIRSCTQKAVSLLRDPEKKVSRSLQRMHVLLALLEDDAGRSGARFQNILLSRLVTAQMKQEELIPNSENWVKKEVMKRDKLQEGGTLRHTLWRHLQGVLTPLLAQILEMLDRDSNLDLLYSAGLSEGLLQFWLDIFEDVNILDLTVSPLSNAAERELDVQCSLLVGGEAYPCTAPFSWIIKQFSDNLWAESQYAQGVEQDIQDRIKQFVSAMSSCSLGVHIERLSQTEQAELGQKYLTDYIILTFNPRTEDEVQVYRGAVLGCVAALQQNLGVPPNLSPSWIMGAAQLYSPRLDTLSLALQLQPQLVPLILKQHAHQNQPDMIEDILAVGMCVEQTKLQPLTSVPDCSSFLSRVELLQPCLQRAFSRNYSALCSPGCLQHLDAIKLVWQGMLVVAAFIEQVVVKVESHDERQMALTLKHCSTLQKVMEERPDLQSRSSLQRLIRILNDYDEESISRELRFGVKCLVCLEDFSAPCSLPCDHVICLTCIKRCLEEQGGRCPVCRTDIPAGYQPAVSPLVKSSLKRYRNVRMCCNSFFLEVVSRFCLSEGQCPQEDMVELLFSMLISSQGGVYKTRELTPFLECVDQSPVVRSVLPKLLLQNSFDQVKVHIQMYLQELENYLLLDEDKTELYRLFINCFQDSLLCVSMSENKEHHQQENIRFLSRLARRQTPSRKDQPAEFLLSMARLRMCLDTAAHMLPRAIGHKNGPCTDWEEKFLEQVKAVCEYSGSDWYKVYLLRTLNRQAGTDCVQAVMNSSSYEWVFPKELLRLQRLVPVEVDRFLCCGPMYLRFRDAVGQVLIESSVTSLTAVLQDKGVPTSVKGVFLVLALFRQVTCRRASPDPVLHPGAQEVELLQKTVRSNITGFQRELCSNLLSAPGEGLMPHLHVRAGEPPSHRLIQELLLHAVSVIHSGNRLFSPLQLIATRPQTMREAFLPTMPDDHTSEVTRWLTEPRLKMYRCRNGHVVMVGECGKPVIQGNCDTCGELIGGINHNPVLGFTPVQGRVTDQTRPGHILDRAERRSEAPNRNLSMAESCVLRLLLHLSMLQGCALHNQGVSNLIRPQVHDVQDFLYSHIEKDLDYLGRTLDLNLDDTAITVHLILNESAALPAGGVHQGAAQWASRGDREQWERTVCQTIISPVLRSGRLIEAQDQIASDDKLSSSFLMKVLNGDPPCPPLILPSDCPTHHVAIWTPPEQLTVERLHQIIIQNYDQNQVPLLTVFLQKVQYVRQLVNLPDLAVLMSDLMLVHADSSEPSDRTIASVLCSIPAGSQKNSLTHRLQNFLRVWNHLRMELANNDSVGMDQKLCEKDVTMESSVEYLSLNRVGPGSCLLALINILSETHNSLVREARKLTHQGDSDYTVNVGSLSENQLVLCHPEKELLPLVLCHCHYTLKSGQQTVSSFDLRAAERELYRRFLSGKPRILTDTDRFLNRQHQDFSAVLKDVRMKIPQEALKASVCNAIRTVLRSFTDVCDAVDTLEIALRFLGKSGGDPASPLLLYLQNSLRMEQRISSNVAKAFADCKLSQSSAVWQLLICWKTELKLRRGQDPLPKLFKEFKEELTVEERKEVKDFLDLTDVELFTLELHEVLHLKTAGEPQDRFPPHWDIGITLATYLEDKGSPELHGLDTLSADITLSKAAEVWKLAVGFKR